LLNGDFLIDCIKPAYLSTIVRADDRRCEFDCKNQTLLQRRTVVDLLMIGDSITQMWELQAYFNNSGLCVINRGIGGDRTQYLLHRFRADALQLKPKLCVIMIGINDTWSMEEDFFRPGKILTWDEVCNQSLYHMDKIIKLSKENNQNIAVCSILPTNMFWTQHEKERHLYVAEYNQELKRLCDAYVIDFIDYYSWFLSSDGESMNMELSVEGVHPNVFGYDIMYSILKDYLDSRDSMFKTLERA